MTQTILFPTEHKPNKEAQKRERKNELDAAWDRREITAIENAAFKECQNDECGVHEFVEIRLPGTPREALLCQR